MKIAKASIAILVALLVSVTPSIAFASSSSVKDTPNALPSYHQYNYQDSTAYTASAGDVGSSGVAMKVGYVAVHWTSSRTTPIIPFGTQLNMESPVSMDGADTSSSQMSTFYVEDTGAGYGMSNYWVDFYWGSSATANQAASVYSIKSVSYTCYY